MENVIVEWFLLLSDLRLFTSCPCMTDHSQRLGLSPKLLTANYMGGCHNQLDDHHRLPNINQSINHLGLRTG